jgi:DNA-binding transcriptional MerR regulator
MIEETAAFPIDALVWLVADALDRAGVEQTNGQVSAAPTERTLRYYRTRGLLDPPVGHRGRTALYVRRHVLQVLAIKRLQAADVPLHEIQQRLVGRSDADLAEIAGIDPSTIEDPPAGSRRRVGVRRQPAMAREQAPQQFWADRPATAPEPAPAAAAGAGAGAAEPSHARIAGLELDAGVRLTFPSTRELTAADRTALVTAMADVLACLRVRRLAPDQPDVERTTP